MSDKDNALEDLFAQARAHRPSPSDDLMARVMADAMETMVRPEPATTTSHPRGFLALIGGWPSLAGLATATVAGIGIGFASPETVTDFTLGSAYDVSALDAGYGGLFGESTGFLLGEDDG
ncbi:MAG: dihydroorotate dehydrogenase [Pseudomonadota bacterium]